MTRLALQLNDVGIVLYDGEQVVAIEPGFAYLGDGELLTGRQAFRQARIDPRRVQHRFWESLNTEVFTERRFAHLCAADLAAKQLEDIWAKAPQDASELVIIVPGSMSADALGLLLGIASEIGLPVTALVDSAIASTRREYGGAVPVHIEMSLHRAILTRLAQPDMVQIDRIDVVNEAGVHALLDIWIRTIAEAFVQQSRFDPLHTAETEQSLLDKLQDWLDSESHQDVLQIALQSGATSYEAEIEALDLIGAAAPVYQQIASQLRAMFRAEDTPALQVTDQAARLPGFLDMLKARIGGEVFVLEQSGAARGALARCNPRAADGQGVGLIRKLPWDQAAIAIDNLAADQANAGVPTHLLFGHEAHEVGNLPLNIGSQEVAGERYLVLAADMPGVSRRHCSVARVNGQCIIEDHSRYGSFLNGHRIDGSSVLQVGDSIRIGSPGFEFQLIKAVAENG